MFDFDLIMEGGGWAEAIIVDTGERHEFAATYLHDALEEFLEAVILLFEQDRVELLWEQEPGMLRWTFIRNADGLMLRAEFPTELDPHNDDYCDLEYSGETSFSLFAKQVVAAYGRMFQTWCVERNDYADRQSGWGYPFPSAQLERLNKLMATL